MSLSVRLRMLKITLLYVKVSDSIITVNLCILRLVVEF